MFASNGNNISAFKGNIPYNMWWDCTETSRITGWGSFTTKKIMIKNQSGILHCLFNLEGTSNSVNSNFYLPISNCLEGQRYLNGALFFQGNATNNGITTWSRIQVLTNPFSSVGYDIIFVTLAFGVPGGAQGSWTASGTKTVSGHFVVPVM
jgi:hypothetical protein